MRRGFISGIVISLFVVFATFMYTSASNAQGSDSSPTIWSGLIQGANLTFGSISNGAGSNRADNTADSQLPQTPSTPSDQTPTASIPTPTVAAPEYVALGDSVAAGLGLPYVDNATSQDRRCGRSSQSYAYEVGRRLDRSVALYACSGASSGDLYTRQWLSNFNPRIQIDQAFAQGTPEIISITVGANDIRWNSLVRACYTSACGTTTQTRLVEARLVALQLNLSLALQQIQSRSKGTPPKVILTGYYNPVSQSCTTVYPDRVTSDEVSWVNGGVEAVNQTLQAVANNYDSFVDFAAVDFSGHDICSTTPWVQGLSDTAPIHPTAEGQQAIATTIVQAANAR